MTTIFTKLQHFLDIEKKLFPFIETLEDRAILIAIGNAQNRDEEFNATQMHSLELAPKATIERRLARMKSIGNIIREKRSKEDKRNILLTLSPSVMKNFIRYGEMTE